MKTAAVNKDFTPSTDITKLLLQIKHGTPAQKMAAEMVLEVILQIEDYISSPIEKSVITRPDYLAATESILKSKYRPQVDIHKSAGTFHTFQAWLDKNAVVLDSLDKCVRTKIIQKAKSEYTKGLLARISKPDACSQAIQVKPRSA